MLISGHIATQRKAAAAVSQGSVAKRLMGPADHFLTLITLMKAPAFFPLPPLALVGMPWGWGPPRGQGLQGGGGRGKGRPGRGGGA